MRLDVVRRSLHPVHVALAAILAVAGTLRFFAIGAESLWFDEALSALAIRRPVTSVWNWVLHADTHLPPYDILLNLWTKPFGVTEGSVRSLSAALGIAGVAAIYFLGRDFADRSVGISLALMTAVSPFHVYYSQEARPYALLFLLTVLSMHAFWRVISAPTSRGWFGWYAFTTVAVLYSHPNAVFVLAGQVAYIGFHLLRRRKLPFDLRRHWPPLVMSLLALSPYVAALAVVTRRVGGEFWIPKPGLDSLSRMLALFTGDAVLEVPGRSVLSSLVHGAVVLVAVVTFVAGRHADRAISDLRRRQSRFLLGWAAGTIAAPIAVSLVHVTVFLHRTAISALPLLLLAAAFGANQLRRPALRWGLVGLLVALPALSLPRQYHVDTKADWRTAVAYLEGAAGPKSAILTLHARPPLLFYLRRQDIKVFTSYGETVSAAEVWVVNIPDEFSRPRLRGSYREDRSERRVFLPSPDACRYPCDAATDAEGGITIRKLVRSS